MDDEKIHELLEAERTKRLEVRRLSEELEPHVKQGAAELGRRDATRVAALETFESLNLLEVLHSVQTDFITVDSETNIFHQMLDNFLKVTDSEYGFIDEMFYTDDGKMYLEARSITNIAWDDQSHALYKKLVSGEIKFDNLNSLYGEAMKSGKPIIANDAPKDPRRCGVPSGHPALNAFLGVPLHAGNEFVGMLGLANAPGGYTDELVQKLEPLIRVCAIIMLSFKIDQRRENAQRESSAKAQEIRRLNQELEHRVTELEHANQELESFAYSVSHDLRQPLRAMDGFSQQLVKQYGDQFDDKGRHFLQRVRSGSQRMGQLIDDLLELSRIGRTQLCRDDLDLAIVARRIANGLREAEPERNVEFIIPDSLRINGDPRLLEAALENLVRNAWKFTVTEPVAQIEIGVTEHDHAYFVRDNGIGFDMAYADKLFGAFQRLHSSQDYEGTGIGLATVQRIVRRHHGRAWATAEVGTGATFYFTVHPEKN